MGAELIGIIAVGATLAGLTLSSSHRQRDDMKSLRGELRREIQALRGELRAEINDLRGEVHGFRVEITERVARIEARAFPGASAGSGGAG